MESATQDPTTSFAQIKETNRRATVRYRSPLPASGRAFFANSSKSVQAAVVDISLGGIGLVLDAYVEPGTLVGIELGNGGSQTVADRIASVSYAKPTGDGRWRCGCEWVHPLAPEELQFLR
jgi:c-di-GMP-binding flagellar brake protein YcgR